MVFTRRAHAFCASVSNEDRIHFRCDVLFRVQKDQERELFSSESEFESEFKLQSLKISSNAFILYVYLSILCLFSCFRFFSACPSIWLIAVLEATVSTSQVFK